MGCFGSSDPNAQLIKEMRRGKTEEQKRLLNISTSRKVAFQRIRAMMSICSLFIAKGD